MLGTYDEGTFRMLCLLELLVDKCLVDQNQCSIVKWNEFKER